MGDEEEAGYSVTYNDGDKEATNWICRAGSATVSYPNGDTFSGTFSEAKKREGEGTYTWAQPEEGGYEEDRYGRH